MQALLADVRRSLLREQQLNDIKIMENARFIELVKQHPQLYDPSNLEFKDVEKKSAVWNKIAQEYNLEGGTAARQKWKNLRDSYVKYLKDTKLGKKGRYANWTYGEQMKFLEPFIEFRTKANCLYEENWSERSTVNEDSLIDKEEFVITEQLDSEVRESFTGVPLDDNFSRLDPSNQQKIYCIEKNRKLRSRKEEDDVDIFFSGLAKVVKKLPKITQAKLKLECSTLILNAEIEYEQMQLTPPSTSSTEYVSVLRVSPTAIGLPTVEDNTE